MLFCLLDIAPPRKDPIAQAQRSGKRWMPAMRALSPLTIWKRSGITIVREMYENPVRRVSLHHHVKTCSGVHEDGTLT